MFNNFFRKRYFFWKSDYVGHNSMVMIFLDQIYLIVLHVQQFLQAKVFGEKFFFGPHLMRKVSNVPKSNALKKLCLAFFFKGDQKFVNFQKKTKTSHQGFF